MSPIDDKVRALRAKADELAKRSDDLNRAIEHIESQLAGVGVSVWLDQDPEYVIDLERDGNGAMSGWLVGFAKLGARWRIAARQFDGGRMVPDATYGLGESLDAPMTEAPIALADAPRAVRIQAAELLETLVTHMTHAVERYIASVDRATAATKK